MTVKSREIHLKSRPEGLPTEDNFELVEVSVPDPVPGQVLLRNIYMSVDPYMRGRMADRDSYIEPFQIGEPLTGGSVGQVVESQNKDFKPGDYVLAFKGWREYALSNGSDLIKVDPGEAPLQSYLGTLGMPGLTAYVGLLDVGQPQEGETVFVSAASGAVGTVVCQLAKIKGCRVVGSAGSQEKIDWLLDVAGIDAAINYKQEEDLPSKLGELCPDGIDVYFDNVGGEHLEAALTHMNNHGRIVACGMISNYNATEPSPAPRNLGLIVRKRLRMEGFIVSDHVDRREQFYSDMGQWVKTGEIEWEETIVEGLENAPQAFIGLFSGENLGKMLVKVGPESTE